MIKRLLALAFICSTFLSIGLPNSTVKAQDNSGKSLTVAMTQPENLDPISVSRFDDSKRDLVSNLFIGLTRFDARRGEVVPALASDWQISSDGLTWVFNLRDDIQWMEMTNGTPQAVRPVTAGDVVFAIQRGCDPRRPSPLTTNMVIIEGCRILAGRTDYWNIDQATLDNEIGVKAIDDTTVEFRLLFPASYFLTMTTLPEFLPLPAEYVGENEVWPLATTLVTSGAWVVAEWDGQHMMLEANPDYPFEREGNLEKVDIRFDLDANSIATNFNSGNIDIARVNGATADTITLTTPDLVHASAGQPLAAIGFSFEYDGVNNPLVRRALSMAIDRNKLANDLSNSSPLNYLPADSFTPRTVIAATTAPGAGFDPSQAQTLLQQAGYPQCANFPTRITIAINDDPDLVAMVGNVIQQWQQNLGCPEGTFEVTYVTRQALIDNAHATLDTAQASRYPAWLITWASDYPDANGWTADALHCNFGVLRTGRLCDSSDDVLDQAGFSLSIRDRSVAYTQAETTFFGTGGNFPLIPLVVESNQWIQQVWLESVSSYGPFYFDRWTVLEHD